MLNNLEIKKLIELLDSNDISTVKGILVQKLITFEKKREKDLARRLKKKAYLLESRQKADEKATEASLKFREELIANQTTAEKSAKALLKSMGIKYEFQKIFYYKSKIDKYKTCFYIVDFYLPDANMAIEIDGEYHQTSKQKTADKKRTMVLRGSGLSDVVRFTNDQVLNDINYVRVSLATNKRILKRDCY